MIKFILVVVCLTVIISKPILLFLFAGFGLAWLLLKQPNCFTNLANSLATPGEGVNEPEEDLSLGKKEYPNVEEIYAREVEEAMKPGYKDDPEWQKVSKKICKQVAKNTEKEEAEQRLEDLTNEII